MKFLKKMIVTICSLGCLVAGATGVVASLGYVDADKSSQISFTEISLESNYNVGTQFTLPECMLVDGETRVQATAKLHYPDGRTQTSATQFLDVNGEYKLIYTGYSDGQVYTKTHTFSVNSPLYNLRGEDSNNVPVYQETDYGTGLLVSLNQGDVFTFNQPIDLSGRTRADGIWTMNSVPTLVGAYDSDVVFKLTDAEDETNSVLIRLAKYPVDEYWTTYITDLFLSVDNGDNWISLRYIQNGTGKYEYEGFTYECKKNYHYGQQVIYSTIGTPHSSIKSLKDQALTFSYDPDEKAFFITHSQFFAHYPGMGYMPIFDLDDERFNDVPWKGFTSNQVYLSVYGTNYQSVTSHVLFTDIDNQDISQNLIKDTAAPTIEVDLEGFEKEDIPNAIVGKNYKVFNAKVEDTDASAQLKVRVYSNYYSKNRVYIPIVNGKFMPKMAGEYFIEYTATDSNGNQSIQIVKVNAVAKATDLKATAIGILETCEAGKQVELLADVTVAGNIGNAYYTISLVSPDGETTYELKTEKSFTFPYAGEYKMLIMYGDFIEEKVLEYTISVENSSSPMAFKAPLLEKYYIKNATYTFPALTAYNIVGNKQEIVSTETYLKIDDGAEQKVTGAYKVTAESTLQIIYKAGENVVYVSDKKSVVDVHFGTKQLDQSAYFVTIGFDKEPEKLYTQFVATETENNSVEFIRTLQAKDLKIAFRLDGEKANYERFNVYLSDCIDARQTIKISYWIDGTKVYYTVNDSENVYALTSYAFNLSYHDFTVSSASDLEIAVNTTMYGEPFKGFTDEKIFLSMDMQGAAAGESAFNLVSINDQTFTESHYDTARPQILYDRIDGTKTLGDIVTLGRAYMLDVLDPNVTVTFYVLGADGNYATSVDGVTLDGSASIDRAYDIQLTQYGFYTVVYNATDTAGNKYKDQMYTIECKDITPPTIELRNKVGVVRSGNTVKVAECIAVDDVSAKCEIYVYVITPTGNLLKVENGGEFTMEYYGEYVVQYTVFDENYNMSKISYTIVREKQ